MNLFKTMVFKKSAWLCGCASVAALGVWQSSLGQDIKSDTPPKYELSEELADTITHYNEDLQNIDLNSHSVNRSEGLEKRAKEANAHWLSDARQQDIEDYTPRVKAALGLTDGDVAGENTPPTSPRSDVTVALFTSSSVPLSTMRAYARQLHHINGVIIMKGAPGGLATITPYLNYVASVLAVDPSCTGLQCDMYDVSVLIDPIAFADYDITHVPAVMVSDSDHFKSYCERDAGVSKPAATITYGDAHLTGHLQALSRKSDKRVKPILAKLTSINPKETSDE